jgi:hypothetical protein
MGIGFTILRAARGLECGSGSFWRGMKAVAVAGGW